MFFSCAHELETVERPNDLIPKDSMQLILQEMMLIEAHVRLNHKTVDDFYIVMQQSGKEILGKYEVDTSRYERSMDYYTRVQEELIEIYEALQDSVRQVVPDEE